MNVNPSVSSEGHDSAKGGKFLLLFTRDLKINRPSKKLSELHVPIHNRRHFRSSHLSSRPPHVNDNSQCLSFEPAACSGNGPLPEPRARELATCKTGTRQHGKK